MTPSGIGPATFRLVAQRLNHCAAAVPKEKRGYCNLKNEALDPIFCMARFQKGHRPVVGHTTELIKAGDL